MGAVGLRLRACDFVCILRVRYIQTHTIHTAVLQTSRFEKFKKYSFYKYIRSVVQDVSDAFAFDRWNFEQIASGFEGGLRFVCRGGGADG